jgi:hypothetical protein
MCRVHIVVSLHFQNVMNRVTKSHFAGAFRTVRQRN